MAKPIPAFSDKELDQIEKMASLGLNLDKIALIMGKSRRTLYNMMERDRKAYELGECGDKNLCVRVERGRAKADLKLASMAYELATSGKHPVMTIFMCKSRLKWSEGESQEDKKTRGPVVYRVEMDRTGKFAGSKPKEVDPSKA